MAKKNTEEVIFTKHENINFLMEEVNWSFFKIEFSVQLFQVQKLVS